MKETFDTTTIRDRQLSAWATTEARTRIQTTDPQIAKAIQRLPDCERVGFSVASGYLRLFSIQRTLSWVKENVIGRKHAVFLKKKARGSSQNAQPSVFVAEAEQHTVGLAAESAKRE